MSPANIRVLLDHYTMPEPVLPSGDDYLGVHEDLARYGLLYLEEGKYRVTVFGKWFIGQVLNASADLFDSFQEKKSMAEQFDTAKRCTK